MRVFGGRAARGASVFVLVAMLVTLGEGATLAARQVGQSGNPGSRFSVDDSTANPGALCSYVGGGAAGSRYLTGIRVDPGPTIWGKTPALRSVGYYVRLLHFQGGAWVHVRAGTLITMPASSSRPAVLPTYRIKVPVIVDPNRFRVIVRLIWYTQTGSVDGWRDMLIGHYRTVSGGVAGSCKGRVVLAP